MNAHKKLRGKYPGWKQTLAIFAIAAVGMGLSQSVRAEGEEPVLPEGKIGARPLSDQEIHDYHLAADAQVSGGLFTVGIGQPAYLEAYIIKSSVEEGTEITGLSWMITGQPEGSMAAFEESPITEEVPIFAIADRELYDLVGRTMLRPDMVGKFTVEAIISTNNGDVMAEVDIVSATYIGVGEPGVFNPSGPQCALCHADKVMDWVETGHATAFTRQISGMGSGHYNEGCNRCHTTGHDEAPGAVNGGFDDVAALVGWTFPEELVPENWETMPDALKNVSNIQCESCHGAGSQHASTGGNPGNISVSFSAGDCAQCHDHEPYHVTNLEWNNSRHAAATAYATGEGRGSCVRCHSAIGFIDFADGVESPRLDYEAITCSACHDPHSAENPHQIRRIEDVTLFNGDVIATGGNGMVCMNCHISRRDAEDYVKTDHGHFGPHHGPQTDMLAGTNAIQYGRHIPSTAHLFAIEDSCTTCHLQGTARDAEYHTEAGGHTFKPAWDGGTPDDPSDDVDLVDACVSCHGPIDSFDFARQDYDDDGIIEGVQTEVEGLLHELAMLLPPVGEPTVDDPPRGDAYDPQIGAAVYNYLFVEEDGSLGVHNTSYAVGILKASIVDLTGDGTLIGDTDNDCLDDEWEVLHFGGITQQDANGDADMDGVTNGMELAAGTLPTNTDSDNDGFSDLDELHSGTDPMNADDNPEVGVSKIYHAAEMTFQTEVGKTYQVQVVEEMGMGAGAWVNVGDPVEGDGSMIQQFVSTRQTEQGYYRVVEVEP